MLKEFNLRVQPEEADNIEAVKKQLVNSLGLVYERITSIKILRRSIDARQKKIWINLRVAVGLDGEEIPVDELVPEHKDVSKSKPIAVIGSGPAGLFCALQLIALGLKPVVFERGKPVRERRRDLVKITRFEEVDPDSNYCFGEGGAGTYSDGKLYTRSGNKKLVKGILKEFVRFGAKEDILVDAHPHIGTNKLPAIIQAMREFIVACGGLVHFESKIVDFETENENIRSVVLANGQKHEADAVVLATGHSARDVFELIDRKQWGIEFKSFALGVRVEHPQTFIDQAQYHRAERGEHLPPAAYSLVTQVQGKGVYSFCMCPGGIIAPCATEPGEVVTNGWSPSKRNNPYANSGIVTQVEWEDIPDFHQHGAFAGLEFQRHVEKACWEAAGQSQHAPAQRLVDFVQGRSSGDLPACSYNPGVVSRRLDQILPDFIVRRLQEGFRHFDRKMKGFMHPEAIVVAPESRTSCPVRIQRDDLTLQSPFIQNLYPCGEGAGYAGGIVSAAIDGQKVAKKVADSVFS